MAADILCSGGLVAFPTETVYGLGADATNADAVARIFAAKGRPANNPLIVHVADVHTAKRQAAEWPPVADRIARAFWPGAVTVVVPRGGDIADGVTAGGPTVGIRVPDHPVALELLRAFARIGSGAVAAPSANRSNRVSPTTADHVRRELAGAVDLILDGGPCRVGIESTVVDCTGDVPTILRPGGVARSQLESAVGGPVRALGGTDAGASASPGRGAAHYAPVTPAYRFDAGRRPDVEARFRKELRLSVALLRLNDRPDYLFELDELRTVPGGAIWLSNDPARYARGLYAELRFWDGRGVEAIWIELPPDLPEWAAVRDRIVRATRPLP